MKVQFVASSVVVVISLFAASVFAGAAENSNGPSVWMNSAKCLNVEGRRRHVQSHDAASCPVVNARFAVTYRFGGQESPWSDLQISTTEENGVKRYAVSVPDWNSDRPRSYAYFYDDVTYVADNQPHELYRVDAYGYVHEYQVFCAKNALTIVELEKHNDGKQEIKIQYSLEFQNGTQSTCRGDGTSGSDGSLTRK